ncbi:hypothetical protein PVAG01_07152 [Phlyctema vagabunda]|uniref:Uncharacterized protein n=1 Tax=Phlyctema vagabunda TaxID=108571 RepID=A0ABR4PBL9_9HELO
MVFWATLSVNTVKSDDVVDRILELIIGRKAKYSFERKRALKLFRSLASVSTDFCEAPEQDTLAWAAAVGGEIVGERPLIRSSVSPWREPLDVTFRYRISPTENTSGPFARPPICKRADRGSSSSTDKRVKFALDDQDSDDSDSSRRHSRVFSPSLALNSPLTPALASPGSSVDSATEHRPADAERGDKLVHVREASTSRGQQGEAKAAYGELFPDLRGLKLCRTWVATQRAILQRDNPTDQTYFAADGEEGEDAAGEEEDDAAGLMGERAGMEMPEIDWRLSAITKAANLPWDLKSLQRFPEITGKR